MDHITQNQFNEFVSELREPELLKQYRLKSFSQIKKSQFPSFKYGLNISIEPKFDFNSIIPKTKIKNNKIIKHDEAKIYLNEELNSFDLKEFLTEYWNDDDKISKFNQAFANDILAIYIPPNLELKKPIEIIYNIKESPFISMILILAGSNSKASILMSKLSDNNSKYISDDIRIISQENSKLDFTTIQNINKKAINLQRRKSSSKKNSLVNWIDICLGSEYTKSSIISSLDGINSTITNTVLFLATNNQQYDIYTSSIHKAPQTISNILTKGTLNHEAKALSRGLIKIEESAFDSNGYEKQEALLLSGKAEADAIPNLEIHNHDVRCTHGSTIGQIDKEKIFYLMSRGLNEEAAKKQIIEGYFLPILENINDNLIKEKIQNSILTSLKEN